MKFAQICPKQALKYTIFVNIQKRQKMAKWPYHSFSGKQFQKGQIWQIWPLEMPNGNPGPRISRSPLPQLLIKIFSFKPRLKLEYIRYSLELNYLYFLTQYLNRNFLQLLFSKLKSKVIYT